MRLFASLLVVLAIFSSCSFFKTFPDSHIEELSEDFIQDKTGVNVDFSGDSPEPCKH